MFLVLLAGFFLSFVSVFQVEYFMSLVARILLALPVVWVCETVFFSPPILVFSAVF